MNTVYSSGVRSTAPDMSHRSLPSGSTSPLMNRIMGSSTSAISASVRTPGMCTYPSLSNASIIASLTRYSSPSMPPMVVAVCVCECARPAGFFWFYVRLDKRD